MKVNSPAGRCCWNNLVNCWTGFDRNRRLEHLRRRDDSLRIHLTARNVDQMERLIQNVSELHVTSRVTTSKSVWGAPISVHHATGVSGAAPGHSPAVVEGLARLSKAGRGILRTSSWSQDLLLGLESTNNWTEEVRFVKMCRATPSVNCCEVRDRMRCSPHLTVMSLVGCRLGLQSALPGCRRPVHNHRGTGWAASENLLGHRRLEVQVQCWKPENRTETHQDRVYKNSMTISIASVEPQVKAH